MNLVTLDTQSQLTKIAATLEYNPVPSFLIAVEEDESVFRFVTLNKAHTMTTGLAAETVAGKVPTEVFPPRFAATITENYRRCVQRRDVHKYEEILALPYGEIWLDTVLSPIFEHGKIVGILGMAQNKTEAKNTEKRLAECLENTNRINKNLKLASDTIAQDLTRSLQHVGRMTALVRDGFQDLGDKKLQMMEKCNKLVDQSLIQISSVLAEVEVSDEAEVEPSEIDFGKWCQDIIALLDPLEEFDIFFPQVEIHCEKFLLDIALRNLMDQACKHAQTNISIDVSQAGDGIVFTVRDDGEAISPKPPTSNQNGDKATVVGGRSREDFVAASKLIDARGGKLWIDNWSNNHTGGSVNFKINGHLVDPDKKYMFMRTA